MRFHPDDSKMFRQWQHNPIAKMAVKRDQRSFLLHGSFKNQGVVSPPLTSLRRANDIMPGRAQERRQFDPKHLIEVKAHGGLRRVESGDFRVEDGMPGVLQGSLNILPREFRIAAQQ